MHIQADFKTLLKAAKQHTPDKNDHRLAILADSATQHLAQAITGYGALTNFPTQVYDADYNQIMLQVFDDSSQLYEFNPSAVLVFMCRQKLFERYCESEGNRVDFAETVMNDIKAIHRKIHQVSGASVLQFTFPYENDMAFGNFGLRAPSSFAFQLCKLNMLLMEWAAAENYCYLADINSVKSKFAAEDFYDEKLYCNAKLAVSVNVLPQLAKSVIDVLKPLKGQQKKCVILDLDNTLWGGVIGDDGIDNIEIGELGIGHAFSSLQLWLKELKKRGIILCICSKNNEGVAKEPFIKHPDMILRFDDIAMFVANWEDKATNIRYIQKTINIGMDSIVFLDDNPFERNLVRELVPDITVPELPENPEQYLPYLQSLNLFETATYSDNDAARTKQYQAEVGRTQLQESFSDFTEYLERLEMKGKAKPFEPYYYPRIAQLTQRSNQFNLRTVRYTEADIERIAKDEHYLTLYFTLEDKFGDHGLVGVVIIEKKPDHVFVDTWLMSCRVLKRGMEEYIVNNIVRAACEAGYETIEGEYIPTAKNAMVKDIYKQFGFEEYQENLYRLRISEYVQRDTQINDK